MKMADMEKEGYFIEYKEDKPFWKIRIDNLLKEYDLRAYGFLGELPEIVFLVGNKPYRFRVINIFYEKDVPERYKAAIKTEGVFAFKCVPINSKWYENVETCSDCGIHWKKIGITCPVCYSPMEHHEKSIANTHA